eukprot:scaffold78493_cov50-Attheya_sp.AAC.3
MAPIAVSMVGESQSSHPIDPIEEVSTSTVVEAENAVDGDRSSNSNSNNIMSSNEEKTVGLEKSCHALPCTIHYDGMAPVGMCFRPTVLVGDNNGEANLAAAQFRGRGLVTQVTPSPLPSHMAGIVWDGTRVGASFRSVAEWHHDSHIPNHLPETLVDRAVDWCTIAHSVHDPIPVTYDE